MAGTATTQERILDLAQQFIQERGYNGFSFRDLANGVGVKSSSIHYYHASKTHLALAVTSRYRKNFAAATAQLRKEIPAAPDLLKAYAQIFKSTFEDGKKVCLCAMLASDRDSIEEAVTDQVRAFFADQYGWLSSVVTDGISQGTVRDNVRPDDFAVLFFSALEGAMMVANANDRSADIDLVADQMIGLVLQTA
ncbi:MAG: TetR/AcrR family transcriptional regulator [Erythrobacter sp.]|uniref:TetR/AcrR family transcriptional regulator n=1 Tax=Erythrobacter sp. TaxID=1042 RepID=UPI003265A2EB